MITFFYSFPQLLHCAIAFLVSLAIMLLCGDWCINALKRIQKHGQPIRDDGPESHLAKANTPTMGGLIILGSIIFSLLLFAHLDSKHIQITILCLLGFGALGFIDDYLKVKRKHHKGVIARYKLLFQACFSLIIVVMLVWQSNAVTYVHIPLLSHSINLGYLYIPFACFVIIGSSNAVNLTDGLDGLVTFPLIMAFGCFMLIAHYKMPGVTEIPVICAIVMGACLGFLWFNSKPAQIFMGDVGSLSLGALVGTMSILTKHELLLPIIGGIFVIEALSVIIQVWYFKATKGKRIFKMAPMHHHYEKLGIPETKVVARFWIASVVFALLGLISVAWL